MSTPQANPAAHLPASLQAPFTEAVQRRMPSHAPRVQAILAQRMAQRALGTATAEATNALVPPQAPALTPPRSRLTELTAHLQALTPTEATPRTLSRSTQPLEMKSVRRFNEIWAQIAAEQTVTKALAKAPQNAGPLNSHMLMLRTLQLMRGLSPDYLRRFLAQKDTLLQLDALQQKLSLSDVKKGSKPAAKTSAKPSAKPSIKSTTKPSASRRAGKANP